MNNQYIPHQLMQFFAYEHLQNEVAKETSKGFFKLAQKTDIELPNNAEKTIALRKLLEAKDCAVRATFFKP